MFLNKQLYQIRKECCLEDYAARRYVYINFLCLDGVPRDTV